MEFDSTPITEAEKIEAARVLKIYREMKKHIK
jgi:hypothetical protein